MPRAYLSFDRFEILNQKTDTKHSDNDWLCMVWTVNDKAYSKTVPLVNQAGSQVLHSGDVLRPFSDYVICDSRDTVTVTYMVINLSAIESWGDQAAKASEFTEQVLRLVAPIYLLAAQVVLGVMAPGAELVFEKLAGAAQPLLDKLSGAIGDLLDTAFQDAITPLLKEIVDAIEEFLGGRPNCNGEVFHDYVIFLPHQPAKELRISKTYAGPQNNSNCGNAPHTKVDLHMHRSLVELPWGGWVPDPGAVAAP